MTADSFGWVIVTTGDVWSDIAGLWKRVTLLGPEEHLYQHMSISCPLHV